MSEPNPAPSSPAPRGASSGSVLYREAQPVPLTWWLLTLGVAALIGWQGQMHRPMWFGIAAFILAAGLGGWWMLSMSKTVVSVVEEAGTRWLHVGPARLPATVVDRSLVIPPTAKQAAMGRQLDPAAYVVHKSWIPTMAMIVLDDPADPTPYWLISTKNPHALLEALGRPVY